jgi:Flp pilus assembly protein TadG
MEKNSGRVMFLKNTWATLKAWAKPFARNRRGNVATIFALTLLPMSIAAGAGVDLTRALVVRSRIAEALDAAGLAVGASRGLTTAQIQTLAQNYFNQNYTADSSYGVPAAVTVTPGTNQVQLTTSVAMPTEIIRAADILPGQSGQFDTINVGYTSTVVWGQTRLWVSLVLDNTGSMSDTDKTGTSKLSALKTATTNLLSTLQGAAATPGDVMVAIVPFSKDVNVGTTSSMINANWIDWSDWESAPANGTPSSSVGPGSTCPYTSSGKGYTCQSTPTNGSNSTSTVPLSGTYKGYICPGVDSGSKNSGRLGRYYNGCYNSVPTQTLVTTTDVVTPSTQTESCSQKGSGSTTCGSPSKAKTGSPTTNTTTTTTSGYTGDSTTTNTTTGSPSNSDGSKSCSGFGTQTCTWTRTITTNSTVETVVKTGAAPYNHTWIPNSHTTSNNTWSGCIMDRAQDYDIGVAGPVPGTPATLFPAENAQSCVPTVMMGELSDDWTALGNEVTAMTAGGSTNQPIGLAWGWQAQTNTGPLLSGPLPNNTSQYIILLSDGLNTQDRWYGDGSDQSTDVDARMASLCTNAKAAGITIYTIYVDLNGTQGNSTVLQDCATDSSKYFDLTTSGAIITTLANIAQQITQLRVSQ